MDVNGAVVAHFEHVIGDRLADAVPGALIEVDLDPHHVSDLGGGYWTWAGGRFDTVTDPSVQQVWFAARDMLQPGEQSAEQVTESGFRQLIAQAEMRAAPA